MAQLVVAALWLLWWSLRGGFSGAAGLLLWSLARAAAAGS